MFVRTGFSGCFQRTHRLNWRGCDLEALLNGCSLFDKAVAQCVDHDRGDVQAFTIPNR